MIKTLFLASMVGLCSALLAQSAEGDWFNYNPDSSTIVGVAAADGLLLAGDLQPVVVAVIDDGLDVDHPDLQGRIYLNEDEVPANGKDDDSNGYVDDVQGWNYLGNPQGENVNHETLELTRLVRKLGQRYGKVDADTLTRAEKEELEHYAYLLAYFEEEKAAIEAQYKEYQQLEALYKGAQSFMREKLQSENVSTAALLAYKPDSEDEEQVKNFLLMAEEENLSAYLQDGSAYFDEALNYHYNLEFDPRYIVNEAAAARQGIAYGNNTVWVENPEHGTHVAGIIASIRNNALGIDGIAPNAVIMPLRAVPAGDERDQDIARAIRYAADNGARVINMSFGKSFSAQPELVKEAIAYAASKDVLMIHAAGNDGTNNDRVPNYPKGITEGRKPIDQWITVAASAEVADSNWLADFSNYGRRQVHLMAPGVNIESLKPASSTATNSGTSMAAPVVAGMAAVIRGAYPELSAAQTKEALLASVQAQKKHVVAVGDTYLRLKKVLQYPGVPHLPTALQIAGQMEVR